MHKEQAMLVDAQSHLHKGTRETYFETKLQQCRSNFLDFLLFMSFWIFDTQKIMIKTNNVKTINAKANKQPIVNSNNQHAHNQT